MMPGRAPWGAGPGIPKRVGRRASNYLCLGGGKRNRKPRNEREETITALVLWALVVLMFAFAAVYSLFS